MADKKKIIITVDEDIAVEVHEQVKNFVDDFYSVEAGAEKIKVEDLE